jgi:hypothetical protein
MKIKIVNVLHFCRCSPRVIFALDLIREQNGSVPVSRLYGKKKGELSMSVSMTDTQQVTVHQEILG